MNRDELHAAIVAEHYVSMNKSNQFEQVSLELAGCKDSERELELLNTLLEIIRSSNEKRDEELVFIRVPKKIGGDGTRYQFYYYTGGRFETTIKGSHAELDEMLKDCEPIDGGIEVKASVAKRLYAELLDAPDYWAI